MKTKPEVFRQLFFRYVERSRAAKAVAVFDRIRTGKSNRKLANILRDHRQEGVESEALIDLRDSFDYWLSFYALLEVGFSIGYLKGNLPKQLSDQAKRLLFHDAVEPYYKQYYPTLLPSLFAQRISKGPRYAPISSKGSEAAFNDFQELNLIIEQDKEVESFLWLLDWGSFGDYDIEALVEIFRSGKSLERALVTDRSEWNGPEEALAGFVTFLSFCPPFLSFLSRFDSVPLIQSIVWHYHGYWFDRVGKELSWVLSKIIDRTARWQKQVPVESGNLLATVDRLTSGRFMFPLREKLRTLTDDESAMVLSAPTATKETITLGPILDDYVRFDPPYIEVAKVQAETGVTTLTLDYTTTAGNKTEAVRRRRLPAKRKRRLIQIPT